MFIYDSLNRRVKITKQAALLGPPPLQLGHTSRQILHDGNLPIAELECAAPTVIGGEQISRYFVRGVGIAEGTGDMIAEIIGKYANNAEAVFYLSNHRGDTLAAYCNISTLVAKYRYDAFGNQCANYCVIVSNSCAPRYTFSTKEYLPDAKLYLYAYRVYDPVAGRWTQRDPIDYQDSPNLYQFCGNNPVNNVDQDGRSAIGLFVIVTLAVVAVGLGIVLNVVHEHKIAQAQRMVDDLGPNGAYDIYYSGRVFLGKNYARLGNAGKAMVDLHVGYHKNGDSEYTASCKTYEDTLKELYSGNKHSLKDNKDLNDLADSSKSQIQKHGKREGKKQGDIDKAINDTNQRYSHK